MNKISTGLISLIKHTSTFKDVYVEVEGSRCLRTQRVQDTVLLMSINYAMAECSKNIRCIAIEFDDDTGLFGACLDSIYASTAAEKYQNSTYKLLKKIEGHGTYKSLYTNNI